MEIKVPKDFYTQSLTQKSSAFMRISDTEVLQWK